MENVNVDKKYWQDKRAEAEKRISSIEAELGHIDLCRESKEMTMGEKAAFDLDYEKLLEEKQTWQQERKRAEAELGKEKKFDKAKFLKNFRILLNKSDIKIGDIEREAGVNAGYVSRLESGKIAADPSVEFVITAAKMLNVSVERLVEGDFTELSPTESYISRVLNSLIQDTQSDRMVWYKESTWELECVGVASDGDTTHPLFRATYGADGPTGVEYNSKFSTGIVEPAGNFYHATLPNTVNKIYVTRIREDIFGEKKEFIEVYLIDGRRRVQPVCAENICCERLCNELKKLYREIELSSSHLHIGDDVRDILDSYMLELPFN